MKKRKKQKKKNLFLSQPSLPQTSEKLSPAKREPPWKERGQKQFHQNLIIQDDDDDDYGCCYLRPPPTPTSRSLWTFEQSGTRSHQLLKIGLRFSLAGLLGTIPARPYFPLQQHDA